MTNRRRPWHQCVVRKVTRLASLQAVLASSPLSVFSGFNVIGSLIALLSGAYAVAVVLARPASPARPASSDNISIYPANSPSGADFSNVSPPQIQLVENKLTSRPKNVSTIRLQMTS